ncbi:uncharacterized protein LOC130054813 [Ostrea edulis]|uniref:uncharacterized protein LOC130054813 n=1 Tax=Ostrea edulis TaxID=37623 RepID=UPI0024AEA877|nr:uncharacterized protein LOC130054813 [Ostrea edulis]
MERTLLLLLALTAGIWAGPINDIASGDTCSTTCTDSTKFGYQPGTTYEYDYDVDTTTLIQGASEGKSGMKMTTKVQVEVLSKCDLVLKVKNVQLHERNPESPENFVLSAMSGEFSKQLEENSLRFSFQDGRIESLCPTESEKTWVLNIKRGILSLIQNTMEDLQVDQKVKEADVTGTCDADYTVSENGWYTVTIKKHKNLLGCTERQGFQTALQGTPYRVPSEIQSLPVMKSSHSCQQEISKSGILKGSSCTEQHLFRPFSRESSGAITESRQTLKYTTEKSGVSSARSVSRKTDMNFEHYSDAASNMKTRKDIERQLVNICIQTKEDIRPETPRLFSDLVYIMRAADSQTLNDVYSNIQSGTLCSDNNQKVRKFFMDAVPMVGTSASVVMLTKMINDNEVTGMEADMWLTTLAFIQSPSKDMIREVLPLLKKNGKALLAVSSLVNTYCKNAACENDLDIANVISALEDKIGYGCYVDENNKDNIILTLRALGNSGYISSATATLNSCISRKDNPIEVRIAAIEAFRRASCENDRSQALKVFNDKEEDSELRIAAYLALMQCPSKSILSTFQYALEKEEVNQVGSFIWSHLTNLMESSSPLKQDIRSILENEYLKKEFDMDKRKFSRNYEGSFFLEKINTGASVESNLIWSSKSFIPRSLMANLTVDLFGRSVNILEIGGRVEGLEFFLESYFGPNGYFTEKDVKKATSQVVKGIDAKKMKKIDSQFGMGMDQLKGALYMRMFGNELSYNSFNGFESLLSGDSFNILEMLISMSKNHDYSFTQNIMFLDTSMIIPTSAGFPLNLTINGTATIDMKASGKADLRKLGTSPSSLLISGSIQPSAAVEISSMMSVDAFVTKSGLKMVSTVHSSTLLKGHLELQDGKIFNANLDMPKDKMEIFSLKTAFFTVHRDAEKEQKMITKNRQTHKTCTGSRLSKVTGLKLCGEIQFPNASLDANAPYFPLTGPVNIDLSLLKADSHKSYNIEARFTSSKKDVNIRMAFDTPGSRIDRALSAEFLLNKADSKIQLGLQSPWSKYAFTGKLQNEKNLKHVSGKFVHNKREYSVVAELAKKRKGNSYTYTPNVEISAPKMKPIQLKGGINYEGMKVLDANLVLSGVSKQPIKISVNYATKRVVVLAKASISFEKKKEYVIESRVQKYATKKAAKYRPYLSIKTPEKELISFGGSAEYRSGKALKVDLTVDRIVSKPLKFFVQLRDASNKKSTGIRSKIDIKSPILTTKLTSMFLLKNKKIAIVRSTLDYVIPRVKRDRVTLNGKLNVANTKSLSAAKGNMILSFKQQSDCNVNVNFDISKNWKHSEATVIVQYGANKKDMKKRIEIATAMNHILNKKQKKFNLDANTKFIFPYLGVNYQMKGKHVQTSKSIDSSLDVLFGTKSSYSASLELKDKSKKFRSLVGKLGISIPGRDIVISNIFDQTNAKKCSNVITIQLENGKKCVIQTKVRQVAVKEYDISTSFNIPSYEMLTVSGQYRLIPTNLQANSEVQYGKTKYAVSLSSLVRPGSRIQLAADIENPARKIIAEFDTRMKSPVYSSKLDVKWDANKDPSKQLMLQGDITFEGIENLEATISKVSPLGSGSINLKHQSGAKYSTHAHAEWNKKKVSVDSMFGKEKNGYKAGLKIASPFKDYKSININAGHQLDKTQSSTNIEIDWKPMKRMSSTLSVKRPLQWDDFEASLDLKTPVPGFERSGVEMKHKKTGRIESMIKLSWNKDFLQADMLAADQTTSSFRDITGRLSMKSTLQQIASLYLAAKHVDTGKRFENSLTFEHNGNTYSYLGKVMHFRNGWNLQSSGNVKLSSPSRQVESSWAHRNTFEEIQTIFKFGSDGSIVDFSVNAKQSMSIPRGTLSFDTTLRSPFSIAEDIALTISHEHGVGMIDNQINYSSKGRKVLSLVNIYKRHNGVATSSHTFSCHGDTKSLSISSQYDRYPLTGKVEYLSNKKSLGMIDGHFDFLPTGLMSGRVELVSQIPGVEKLKLSMDQSNERGETVTRSSIVLPSGDSITMENRGQWNNKKSFNTVLTTPHRNLRKMTIGAEFSGNSKSFHTSANLMVDPLVGAMSVTSQWSSYGGIIASIQVKTPFEQYKQSSVSFTHNDQKAKKVTELSVEYLPGKTIKVESTLRPNLQNLEGSIALTTPFQELPYSAALIRHTGNSRQFQCHGEIEYTRGKKIQGDLTFSNDKKLEGTLVLRSPFAKDFIAAFNHEGSISQFSSHAEMQYGKSKKYEITGNYGKSAGSILIKSPLHDDIAASFKHMGTISDFSSHLDALYGRGKKYELDAKYSQQTGSISIKSPLSEDMRASFQHKGEMTDFVSQAEFQYGKSKKYEANAKLSLAKTWTGSLSFDSPVTDDFATSFSHAGKVKDFKITADAKYGKHKGSITAMFKNAKKTIGSLEFKSSFVDDMTAAFSHEGSLKTFDTSASLKKGRKVIYETSVAFSNGKKLIGSATLKTPFHKDVSATFKHSGDLSGFSTTGAVKVDKKMQFKLNADLVNKKSTKAKIQIQNPFTETITLILVKKGKPTNMRVITNALLGKGNKYTADITMKRGSASVVIVNMATPIPGYKKIKGIWKFSGNKRSFKTSVRGSIGKEFITADLKMSIRPNFKADISFETPFKGLKKAGVILSHQGTLRDFKCHGEVTLGKKKLYNGDIIFTIDPKIAVSIALQTPFRKFENTELSVTHDGSLQNFNNQVNIMFLNKKRIASSLKMDFESDISVEMSVQTPFKDYEMLQGSFSHKGTWKKFQIHAEGSDGSNKKFTGDIDMDVIDHIKGNMQLTTPFQFMHRLKGSISHDGTFNNFRSHLQFQHNNDKSEMDVNFSSLANLEGKVIVKSPYIKTIEGTFLHKSSPMFTSSTIKYGGKSLLDGRFSLKSSPVQGLLILDTIYTKPLKATIKHSGTSRQFKTDVQMNYGKQNIIFTTEFDSTNDISGRAAVTTTFGKINSLSASFSHAGRISNFKCHAEVSANGEKVEGDVTFNSLGPIEGTLAIRTPFTDYRESDFSFRHNGGISNFNSHADYSLEGQKSEVQLTVDTDRKVNIDGFIKRPSSDDIIFKLNHAGSGQRFKSGTELTYGGEKKIQGTLSFNTVSSLSFEASLKSKCPVVKNIQVSVSQDGTSENFNIQSSGSFNGKKVTANFGLDRRSGMNGFVTLKTPFSEDIKVMLKHNGAVTNFKTVGEISYSGRKQIEIDTSLDVLSSVSGQMSLKTPLRQLDDVQVHFRHDGDLNNFRCNGKISLSGKEMLSADISYDFKPISVSFNIKSIAGKLSGAFTHAQSTSSMQSHAELNVNGENTQADITYSNNGIKEGTVRLSTPFSETSGASFTHENNDGQMKSSINMHSGDKSIISAAEIAFDDGMSGKFIITTPFEGFRESKADFTYSLSSSGLKTTTKATFRQKSISADLSFDKTPLQGSIVLKTPFNGFEEMKLAFNHISSGWGFRNHVEGTMRGKTVEMDTAFNNKKSISASATIKTPIAGMNMFTASFNHEVNANGISSVAKVGIEKDEISVEATLNKRPGSTSSVIITTPYSGYEKQSASFVHSFEKTGIQSHFEASARGKKVEVDANVDFEAGNLLIRTPFEGFETQEILFTVNGETLQVKGTFRGKIVQLEYSIFTRNGIQHTLSLKTPFPGFEEQAISIDNERTLRGYQTRAEVTYQRKKIELTASLNIDTIVDADLQIITPYTGFESQRLSFRVESGKVHAIVSVMQETIEFNGELSSNQGLLSLKSTLKGFETQSLSFTFDDKKVHAQGSYRQKSIEVDGELSAKKGSLSIKTPFTDLENQNIKFIKKGPKIQVEGTLMQKTVEMDISFRNNRKMEGNIAVRTPFLGYQEQEVLFSHDTTGEGCQTHAEVLFNQEKSEFDLTVINGLKKEFKVSLKTPFKDFEEQDFSVDIVKSSDGLRGHAEGNFNRKKIESDISFDLQPQMSANLVVKTPFVGFEKQNMKFTHELTSRDIISHLEGTFRNQKLEADLSVSLRDSSLNANFNMKTPINDFEVLSASTSNTWSSNGYTTHLEVGNNIKKIEFDSSLDTSDAVSVSMSLKSPFTGFESTVFTLNKDGALENLQVSSNLVYGSSQTVSVSLRNIVSDSSREHSLKLQSPYNDISTTYTQSSDNGIFQSQTDFSVGSQYSFSQTNTLQYNDASLVDFTATTTYTIDGISSTTMTKLHHEGTLGDFKTDFSTRYGTEEAIVSVQFKNTDAIEGSLSVKSPVPYLRNIDAKFSHSGDLDQFRTSADFQHENTGKMEGTLNFFRRNWRRISSVLVIKTPFSGFEQTKLTVKHGANRNSIESIVSVGYGNDQHIRAAWKVSLSPMEVDILFKSPFDGMKNLKATVKTTTTGRKYNSEMTLSREDHTINLQSTIDLESTPMSFNVALSTPFSGLKSTKLMVSHNGRPLDFTTSVNVQTSIGNAKSDARFRYMSMSDIDSSFEFNSDISGLENVRFSVKNDKNGNEYRNHMKASWMKGHTIVSDATYSTSETWRITTHKAGLTISTPFSKLRSLNIQGSSEKSSDSAKQSLLAEINDEKLLDTEFAYAKDSKHSMSFVMREPQPMKFDGEAEMSESVKYALVSINLDTASTERQAKFETKYVTDSYNQRKEVTVKVSTPSKSVEIKGSGEMSSSRMLSSWDILIDDSQIFGIDAEHSLVHSRSNYENGNNLKLRFPERSIALSGSYQTKYGKKSIDGSVMWDADRDTSKKIGASASLTPQGDSMKADVSFEIPSIGKDVKLDSEMTLKQGSVVFDGKTEFKYSKDEDKTVVINSRIEDISRGSNKNYTFSFGLRHIFSSVDVQFKSHVGMSDEKYSSGIKVDYLTSKRINKNFALMGEIDSLRRQINVEVTSPIKSMIMSGKIETKPYRLSLRNMYDNTKEIDSRITFDPENKLLDAQINYDIDNPANVLHFIAKYVNDSAILAEVYRDENSRRITDNLLAMRLNTSRILHTRIHWRPTMIQDLKVSGLAKIALASRQMNTAFSEAAKAVGDELNSKYNLIRQAASEGYRPYGKLMEEIMTEIEKNYPSVDMTLIRKIIKSNPVEWQNFPGKEAYNVYVEATKEIITLMESRGSKNYAELMNFIEQQFVELSAVIESSMKKYQAAVSTLSGNHVSEYLKSKYDVYSRTLSEMEVPDMASQYTNAIYNARDQIASRMNGPVLKTIKQAGDQSYQLAKNAYKFWEVEENIKSVMTNIFDMIKKDIEEEFAILKTSISNLQNSRITVFNPKSGEIQMDTYLPLAMPSLRELPKISVAKYVNRFHSYVPKYSNKWGSLSEYIPDSDVSNWIPPFRAVATLNGNRVTTFDGEEYAFSGKCSYVLARDYTDGNFSVIMNFLGKDKQQLIIMTANQKLQIAPNGKLRVDGKIISTPYRSRELSVVSEEQSFNVYGRGFTVNYNIPRDQLKLVVSGWYHGKVGGLFGTNNNEVYDDMMTSSRRTVNDVDPFVNSWEVDSKCR